MKLIILIALDPVSVTDAVLARVHTCMPGAEIHITQDEAEIKALLPTVEIIAGHIHPQLLTQAVRLRWYQQWGAGTDWLLRYPEIANLDFQLTNASGVHAIPISEHIFAFLLAFARNMPQALHAQQEKRWGRDDARAVLELAKKTLLLVGVGAIGQRTARLAQAFGMRVIGIRRHPGKAVAGVAHMVGPEQMDDVLPEADFVVVTAPLTAETRGMFSAAQFARMKPSAYLVNIGRGGTINEADLVTALQNGQIAGAGLDVFTVEPLPAESPLWSMPNVLITAHYSGDTPAYGTRAMEIFLDNLEHFQKGETLHNLVDKQRGY